VKQSEEAAPTTKLTDQEIAAAVIQSIGKSKTKFKLDSYLPMDVCLHGQRALCAALFIF
jgi:hypothetical protein